MNTRCALFAGLALGPLCFLAAAQRMPALHGSDATTYLKQQGVYNSLGEAVASAMYGVRPDGMGFAESNPRHEFVARFTGAGLEIDGDGWRSSWRLRSVGYGERQVAAKPARLEADGRRIELRRGESVTEWYVNSARGLEQGFTLWRSPGQRRAGEKLRLTMAVSGDLKPRKAGAGVDLVRPDGTVALHYRHLVVMDAKGRELAARMVVADGSVWVEAEDAGAVWPLTVDPDFVQQGLLKASNTSLGDSFGFSVAVSGDTVVVGAFGESSNATGVNGDQTNGLAPYSGAAYVFVRNGSTWSQQAYLKASNTRLHDNFGYSVAVSGDTVVVGAPEESSNAIGVNGVQSNSNVSQSGAAYVFVRNGVTWSLQAYLKASTAKLFDVFGSSVAVSDGTVVVGAPGEGASYVFVRNGVTWSQQALLTSSGSGSFGTSVAVSGNTVVLGAPVDDSSATGVNGDQSNKNAPNSGAAYVFVRNGTTWSQQAYLKASNTEANDQFGRSVAASGDTVVVGAIFESSNATGVNGDQNNNSAFAAGAAYVFVRNGVTWSQQAYLKASNSEAKDFFGGAVAVSGDTVVVGAESEASNATGVNGDQTNNTDLNAGAAYTFVRNGVAWSQQDYLKASDTAAIILFGGAVAVSGDTAVIGLSQDSCALNIEGEAYIFSNGPTCSYTLSASNQSVAFGGGSGTVDVTGPVGCGWTSKSNDAWLTITAKGSENGNGTVGFLAALNTTGAARSGTLTIAGKTFTVNQAGPCSYTLSATSLQMDANGGTGTVDLATSSGCGWSAVSSAPWLTVTAGSPGSGNGTVSFLATPNLGSAVRSATLTIGGQTFTVNQSGTIVITDVRSITDFGDVANFTSGSWLQVKGVGLAPTTRIWQASDFNGNTAPDNLDNVSVLFNGKFGFMYFTKPDDALGPSQINVQAPADLPDGPVNIVVLNHFAVSNTFVMQKTALAPGMFSPPKFNVGGKQYLVATYGTDYFFVGNENLLPGAPFRPAKPGDVLYLYGVGFGDVTVNIPPGVIPTVLTQLNAQVQFQFGPALVTPYYAGYYPNFIGLDLFGLVVPDVPDGDHQITVLVNGQPLAQTLYLTVKR